MTTLPVPQVEREKKIRGWPGSIHQSLDQERKGDRYRFPFRKGKEKGKKATQVDCTDTKKETLNPKLKCGIQDMCGNKGFVEPCFIAVRQGGDLFLRPTKLCIGRSHVIPNRLQPFISHTFYVGKPPMQNTPFEKKLCTLPCVCMYRSDKREKSFLRVQFGIFDQIISFRLSLPLLPVSRKKGKTRSEHKKTFKVACAQAAPARPNLSFGKQLQEFLKISRTRR